MEEKQEKTIQIAARERGICRFDFCVFFFSQYYINYKMKSVISKKMTFELYYRQRP